MLIGRHSHDVIIPSSSPCRIDASGGSQHQNQPGLMSWLKQLPHGRGVRRRRALVNLWNMNITVMFTYPIWVVVQVALLDCMYVGMTCIYVLSNNSNERYLNILGWTNNPHGNKAKKQCPLKCDQRGQETPWIWAIWVWQVWERTPFHHGFFLVALKQYTNS